MRQAAIWVEPTAHPETLIPWDAIGRPQANGRIQVAGTDSAPETHSWLKEHQINSLILLSRTEHVSHSRRLANILTGAQPGLLCATLDVTSNAIAALTRAADSLSLNLDPASTFAAMKGAIQSTVNGVWLRSVAKLHRPHPSFSQYLRSLLPFGPGYLVIQSPQARISPELPLQLTHPAAALLVAAPDSFTDIPEPLKQAFPGLQILRVPPISDHKSSYGSNGVEFIVDGPLRLQPYTPQGTCPSCHFIQFTPACPYCHLVPQRKVDFS